MNIHKFEKSENEALKTLTLHTAQFPRANSCIASQARVQNASVRSLSAAGRMNVCAVNAQGQTEQEDATLEVIWAGRHDDRNNRVICQLTSKDSSILNSYYAKVVDEKGQIVVQDRFVSFDQDIAFASLIVPKDIFDECSVWMDMAMVGKSVRTASRTIPLDLFNVQDIKAVFEVDSPRVTRAGGDKIRISYYYASSTRDYDYVYPGRKTDQMYFPSAGAITIDGVELEAADARLMISNGKRDGIWCKPERIDAEDSMITYSFKELWEGRKLSDCFDLKNVNTKADYLLTITAIDKEGRQIMLMLTNIAELLEKGDPGRVKEIQEIDVYLDCFAAGTQIRMADGSMRAVENIRTGDLVRTENGGQVPVREVQVQEDCQVLGLLLAGGRTLSVTDGHAVCTKDGAYPAFRLKEGQEVLTEDGTDIIKQVTPHCERLYPVYALFLEGDEEWLYAGGVKVHSSDCGEVFQGRDWVREDLPEEWLADYDNALAAGMIDGRR